MQKTYVFVSHKYDDLVSLTYLEAVDAVLRKLTRVHRVDGRSLHLEADFSGTIVDCIRKSAKALIAVFAGPQGSSSNVIFEVGVAVGADLPVILAAASMDNIPVMLRGYDVVVPEIADPRRAVDFTSKLERKLRVALQAPDDHLIEEKLYRRYSEEEKRHFQDYNSVRLPVECIKAGDLRKALAILRGRLEAEPNNLDVRFLLADTLYLQGCSDKNPQQREECFEEQIHQSRLGLEIDSRSLLCHFSLATGCLRLGDFGGCRAALQTLLDLDPDFSPGHYTLACVDAILSDKRAMLAALARAVALHPPWKEFVRGDPDFLHYWQDPDWQEIVY